MCGPSSRGEPVECFFFLHFVFVFSCSTSGFFFASCFRVSGAAFALLLPGGRMAEPKSSVCIVNDRRVL